MLKSRDKMKSLDFFHCNCYFQYLMKRAVEARELEILAVDGVEKLLGKVPSVQVESVEYQHRIADNLQIDGRIGLSHGGTSYQLLVEVKPDGAPRHVRSGVFQLKGYVAHIHQLGPAEANDRWIPLLASPYLSPQSRAICADHDVAYLDLVGNSHLAFGDVYIDRAVADQPKSETRALRSIFTPKAAAILRVMLRDPDRPWRVVELAEEARASLGHVSNVCKALLSRELIEKGDDGAVLTNPDGLLKLWRGNYRQPLGRRITGYTRFHGRQIDERLRGKLSPYPHAPRAIYSSNSAAGWLAPFARDGTHSFYADEQGTQLLRDVLELTPAAIGPNVALCEAFDDSLFADAVEPSPGIFCTSPVTTYLDLWNGNERQREAASHLAEEFFPWLR